MRSIISSSVLFASLGMLSACGVATEDNAVTETRMDDLDSLEGTISDDPINTDQSTGEGPMEAPPVGTSIERPAASKEEAGPVVEPVTTGTEDKADAE